MWNRVLLAVAGYGLGWMGVRALTCPLAQRRTYAFWAFVSAIAGVAAIVWLGAGAAEAGVAGAWVYLLVALVAYAGHARQISKMEPPPPAKKPVRAVAKVDQTTVLLVWPGEPARYEGPQVWARHLCELEARGERVPHWFVRPFAYARIRAAYRALEGSGGASPYAPVCAADVVAAFAAALEARLGARYRVQGAALWATPELADTLVCLVEQGLERILIVPLGLDARAHTSLRDEVTCSRVREMGAQVSVVPPPADAGGLQSAPTWSVTRHAEILRRLMQGMLPLPLPEPGPEVVDVLQARLLAAGRGGLEP